MGEGILSAGVVLPGASQNQLGRVKAICDLARLVSGVYCTIIIIHNTNLINFYNFHLSFQCIIKRGFLEIRCLCTCTKIHMLDETMFTHTHAYPYKSCIIYNRRVILCCEQSRASRRNLRKYLRSNVFNVVTQKWQNLAKYLYLISIVIVVTQNIFLRCSKINLKIADRLDLLPLFQTLPHYSLHRESPPLFPLSSRKAIPHCRKYALAAIGK